MAPALVEFDRKPLDRDALFGFVPGWSKRLTLIHYVDANQFDLDGYRVFRNDGVRRWREVDDESIITRALRIKRIKPKTIPGLNLENWSALLESANTWFPLLVIHREAAAKGTCQVGRLTTITRSSFGLKEIDPDATWDGAYRYKFADLTLVDFGSAYEDALARVAAAEERKKAKRS